MKPVLFALLATLCYAVANVILDLKLSKYNNLTIMVCYGSIVFFAATALRHLTKTRDPSFNFPTGSMILVMVVLGLVYTAADYFYIGAYTNGGDLMTITCITVMFPVFATIIKFAITKSLPNMWQVGGYAFAILAVVLVVKGSMAK